MKKNKIINIGIILATAALFTASCASEKELNNPLDNTRINLSLSAAGATQLSRATPITGDLLPGNSKFALSAFTITGKTLYSDLNKKTLTTNSGGNAVSGWSTYYWPVGDNLKFYAFYPIESEAKGTLNVTNDVTTPKMELDYNVNNADFDNQDDLLYAYKQNPSASGTVDLQFQHALTRLTFQCKVTNASEASITSLRVTNVKFKNVIWGAKLTVNPAGVASWVHTSSTKADQDFDVTGAELVKATPVFTEIFSNETNNSFLMIPSAQSAFDANATVEVTFLINDITPKTGTFNLSTLATTNASQGWPIGKHVNYQMTFDGISGAATLIVNTISVVEWGDKIDVPVPIN